MWLCIRETQAESRRISTHTSRVGCDAVVHSQLPCCSHFYSHIPCGMWPIILFVVLQFLLISTHTSRVGCDKLDEESYNRYTISTHTSRVGCDIILFVVLQFLLISTHTSRVGCDSMCMPQTVTMEISTHTSRVGCDAPKPHLGYGIIYFYSHIPCGMWPRFDYRGVSFFVFLLTHPVWDVTFFVSSFCAFAGISTHTSRVGCDRYI